MTSPDHVTLTGRHVTLTYPPATTVQGRCKVRDPTALATVKQSLHQGWRCRLSNWAGVRPPHHLHVRKTFTYLQTIKSGEDEQQYVPLVYRVCYTLSRVLAIGYIYLVTYVCNRSDVAYLVARAASTFSPNGVHRLAQKQPNLLCPLNSL